MGAWTESDALAYTAGVDRSPTEVSALFLADHPDGDPVEFLVDALGLDEDAAREAVALLEPATAPDGEPAKVPTEVELTADGLAGLSREQLKAVATEAGITVGNKGNAKLVEEILGVVAWADAVDAAAQGS